MHLGRAWLPPSEDKLNTSTKCETNTLESGQTTLSFFVPSIIIYTCISYCVKEKSDPVSNGQDRKACRPNLVEAKCRIRSHLASTADQQKMLQHRKFIQFKLVPS